MVDSVDQKVRYKVAKPFCYKLSKCQNPASKKGRNVWLHTTLRFGQAKISKWCVAGGFLTFLEPKRRRIKATMILKNGGAKRGGPPESGTISLQRGGGGLFPIWAIAGIITQEVCTYQIRCTPLPPRDPP